MVTVKQGKQIASLINSFTVAEDFASKAWRENNDESYRLWRDARDLSTLVLGMHFNIFMPNYQASLDSYIEAHGAERTGWRVTNEYKMLVQYINEKA
jgi:hypothetical protein